MNGSGSEVVSDEERAEQDKYLEERMRGLEELREAGASAQQWLDTPLGKAVILAIRNNKFDAMQMAVSQGADDKIKEAQYSYQVWEGVEAVIGAIITDGVAAATDLYTIHKGHEHDTGNS